MRKILSVFLCFSQFIISQTVRNVPSEYATIQSAINSSSDSDIVLVDVGIYKENINFSGKNIQVTSNYYISSDVSYISQTIIDGDNLESVVTFENDEGNNAKLIGFTIINGYKFSGTDPNTDSWGGGGIRIISSSPTLDHLSIHNNSARNGGGILIWDFSNPIVTDVDIFENTSTNDGGGISMVNSSSTIESVKIYSNIANSKGGGVFMGGSDPNLTNILIHNNQANLGGAIGFYVSTPEINFVTLSQNLADVGGGLWIRDNCNISLNSSLLWDNDPNEVFVGTYDWPNTLTFNNCNVEGCLEGMDIAASTTVNWDATNFCEDPLFVDVLTENFHISDYSPCIGQGNLVDCPSVDLDGNERPSPSSSNPDIGCYENSLDTPLPVELISFTASITNNGVLLNWQTAMEINNYGFQIEKQTAKTKSKNNSGNEWEKIGLIKGSGNSNSPKSYSFIDETKFCGTIQYRLKQIDLDGSYEYSQIVEVELPNPTSFELLQNYPNPFNPNTTIEYSLPINSYVQVVVFDITGRKVFTLVNEIQKAGWHQVMFDCSDLSSGIYFYHINAGNFTDTKKLVLVK